MAEIVVSVSDRLLIRICGLCQASCLIVEVVSYNARLTATVGFFYYGYQTTQSIVDVTFVVTIFVRESNRRGEVIVEQLGRVAVRLGYRNSPTESIILVGEGVAECVYTRYNLIPCIVPRGLIGIGDSCQKLFCGYEPAEAVVYCASCSRL